MTNKELILDGARRDFAAITATALSSWGMLPDEDHLDNGGYHCGCQDIIRIGKWATAGSSQADYSVRQERDRVGGNTCMAIDGPPKWGNGGDAAWIRHNNLLQQQLAAGDPELGALRAINYTPDGKVKRRYDTNNRAQGIIPSTDTVLWHTHYEFWRNTAGTDLLRRTVARMALIMRAAIAGTPVPGEGEEIMILAVGPDGQTYRSNLLQSFPDPDIRAASLGDLRYVAGQAGVNIAHGPRDDAEWDWGGWRRKGWSAAVFGPVPDLGPKAPHGWAVARRTEAVFGDLEDSVTDAGYEGEPNGLHAHLVKLGEQLAALSVGGVTQDMVDAAVVKALTNPDVVAALAPMVAEQSFQGAQRAEGE